MRVRDRWSTWVNTVAMVAAAFLSFGGGMGLSSELTAKLMFACTVVVGAAQLYRQEPKGTKDV